MNQTTIKSLEELLLALLEFEPIETIRKQTSSVESPSTDRKTSPIFKPVASLKESDIQAYRGWGINE